MPCARGAPLGGVPSGGAAAALRQQARDAMSDEAPDEKAGGDEKAAGGGGGGGDEGLAFNSELTLGGETHEVVEESDNKRFLRYKEELGRGAFKTVYKGYDDEEGVEVAWNKLPTKALQEKERSRVSEEIAIMRRMDHPAILRCSHAWVDKGTNDVNFITDFMTSGSLRE